MRKRLLFVLVILFLSICPAQAELIFLDNYTGMAAGSDLKDIQRTPTVGPANSAEWISHGTSSTANAAASLDGMSAGVRVPVGSTMDYLARLGTEYGGGSFLVHWDIIVDQVSASTDYGMFTVRFPKEESMQILFGFLNDGRIIRFDKDPHDYGTASIVNVGTFEADTGYNISLLYDLVGDKYSVSINGVDIFTNVAIPDYLDRISINQFGFDINLSMTVDGYAPQGNAYYVDNISFTRVEAVPEPSPILLIVLGLAGLFMYRKAIIGMKFRRFR